jgi:hypothetical protein
MSDKGLLFFTLALVCFWLVFDDLVGKKRLSNIAQMLTPDFPGIGEVIKDKAKEATADEAKELNEKAPGVFFDPEDEEDKKKVDEDGTVKGSLYDKFKDKYMKGPA